MDYTGIIEVNIPTGMTKDEFNGSVELCIQYLTGAMDEEISKTIDFCDEVFLLALKFVKAECILSTVDDINEIMLH